MRLSLFLSVFAPLVFVASSANASLIVLGVAPDNSNALQAGNEILGVQDTPTESGCILFGNLTSQCPSGFTGGDQTQQSVTRTAAALGIADGADLRITFDGNETGNGGITINALRLLVWNAGGTLIFSADISGPVVLASTKAGNGKPELVFGLDPTQAAALDMAGFGPTSVIGLAANLSASSDGPDSFYGSDAAASGFPTIPEPSTLLLLGTGLAGVRRWRRRSAR